MKNQPTQTDIYSVEGKKEAKVRLAHIVKTNFCHKIWKWSSTKIEITGLTEVFGPSYPGSISTLKGQI